MVLNWTSYFALLCGLFFFTPHAYSQTTLTQGDIVVLGVNANATCSPFNFPSAEDVVYLAFMTEIEGSTSFILTDNGWERSNPGLWGNSEGAVKITYEGTDPIPAGTVITFRWPDSYEVISPPAYSGLWSFDHPSIPAIPPNLLENLDLNVNGDQLYIFNDGTWINNSPPSHNAQFIGEVLYGFNIKSEWISFNGTSTDSGLHPDVDPCYYYNTQIEAQEYSSYTGPTSPAIREVWIERITDNDNWTDWVNCADYVEPIDFLDIIDFEFDGIPDSICAGADPIALPTTQSTIEGSWSGTGVSSNEFDPMGLDEGVYQLVFTPNSSCIDEETFEITVTPNPSAAFTYPADNFCVDETIVPDSIANPGGTFNFSPDPGDGATVDPVTGEIADATGGTTYTVQYTTGGECAESATQSVTVFEIDVDESPRTIALCEEESPVDIELEDYDLEILDGASADVFWYEDSGLTNEITSLNLEDEEVVYAQIVDGPCESDPIEVTFDLSLLPGFQNVDTLVESCGPYELPDIEALNDHSNNDYYFFPDGVTPIPSNEIGASIVIYLFGGEGDCTEEIEIDITVNNPNISDSFSDTTVCDFYTFGPFGGNQVVGYYSGPGGTGDFYETSDETTESGTYYAFAGTADCFVEEEFEITINDSEDPEFSIDTIYCEGETPDDLPTTSDNDIAGIWSPSDIDTDNVGETTYTFTPDSVECANDFELIVMVNEAPQDTVSDDGPYCEGEEIQLNASGGDSYEWTGPEGFSSSEQNPSVPNSTTAMGGTYTVTVTNNNGCTAEGSTQVEVEEVIDAEFDLTDTYCQGETPEILPTTSDNGIEGSWTPDDIDTDNEGTEEYIFTPSVGFCAQEDTLVVTVLANPSATASNTGPYCVGETIELMAEGGETYSWTGPDGFSSSEQNPSIPNSTTAMGGTYTVTVTDSSGCTAEESTEAEVNENPSDPVLSVDCSMGSGNGIITVTSPTGSEYEYSLDGGAYQSSNEFIELDNGNYEVQVLNTDTGCESGISTIEVNCGCADDPEVDLSTLTGEVCGADSIVIENNTFGGSATEVNLTHDGNGTVDPLISSDSPFDFTYTADPSDAGSVVTITVTTDNPLGAPCEAAVITFELTVNEAPQATVSNDGPYCEGEEIQLNASGGDSYEWTGPDGFSSSEQNPSVPNSTTSMGGTYTVTVTDSNGCTDEGSTQVEVEEVIETEFDLTDTYCQGETPEILPTTSDNGVEGSWTPAVIDTDNEGTEEYTFTPSSAFCAEEYTLEVTVLANSSATASNTGPYCVGETIELSAEGGETYSWTGPDGFTSSDQNPVISDAAVVMMGTYEVEVTDDNGCTAVVQTEVEVFTNPNATASNTGPYCEGELILLSSTGGTNFSWTGPDNFTSTSQNPTISGASPENEGMYFVTVTDVNGCLDSAATEVVINDLPSPSASNNGPICDGDDLELETGSWDSYEWSGPFGFTSDEQNPVIPGAGINFGGIYTVEVTDINGCAGTATTEVVVESLPTLMLDSIGCEADLTTWFISFTIGGDQATSSSGDIEDLGGGSFEITNIDTADNVTITITDTDTGCSDEITFTPPDCDCPFIPAPESGGDVEYCEGDPIPFLSANAIGGYEVDWYDASSGGNLLLEGSNTYLPGEPGIYYAEASDPISGCISSSRTAISLTENPNPTFQVVEVECAADLLTYSVEISTNGDTISSNEGQVSDLGGGAFEVSEIPTGVDLNITILITNTGCETTLNISAPSCNCPTIDPPQSDGDENICEGDGLPELSVSVDPGISVNWYDAATGGMLIEEGSTTYLPNEAGTFYAEAIDTISGCISNDRTPLTLTINPLPTFELTDTECASSLDFYTVTFNSNAETVIPSSGMLISLGNDEYEVTDIPIDEVLVLTLENTSTGCSITEEIDPPICDCPMIDSPVSGGDVDVCQGDPIDDLEATSTQGYEIDWYDAPAAGNLLLEGSETFSTDEAGTYYAEARDPVTACVSDDRIPVILTINPTPQYTFLDAVCSADQQMYTVTIETDADEVLADFGTVVSLGSDIYDIEDIPIDEDLSLTLTFTATDCSSGPFFVPAPDCDCPTIDPPSVVGDDFFEICEGEPLPEFEVDPGPDLTTDWYNSAAGGSLLLEGSNTFSPTFTAPGSYFFYAESRDPDSDCTSDERTLIVLEIYELPELNIGIVACDVDGNTYFVELNTDTDVNITANFGVVEETSPGNWIVSEIDLNEEVIIEAENNSTGCMQTTTLQPPDCDCPAFDPISDTTACNFLVLDEITGVNLSGNEAYYSEENGMGNIYFPGDTLFEGGEYFIFDENVNCTVQSSFELTLDELILMNEMGHTITECSPDSSFLFMIADYEELLNEGSGAEVNWYADQVLMTPIVTNVPVSNGSSTVYVQVINGVCVSDTIPVELVVAFSPEFTNPGTLTGCDSLELPAFEALNDFPNNGYYADSNGMGTMYFEGDVLYESDSIYLYGGTGDCIEEILIEINVVPGLEIDPIDSVLSCGNYELPAISGTGIEPNNSSYFTEADGEGDQLDWFEEIENSGTYYARAETANCSDEVAFYVEIVEPPVLDSIVDQSSCTPLVLSEITGNNLSGAQAYFSESGGNGTMYQPGDTLFNSGLYYAYDTLSICVSEVAFEVEINSAPIAVITAPDTVCVGDDVQFMASPSEEYLWSGPSGFNSDLQDPVLSNVQLSNSGIYTLLLTDDNNCQDSASIELTVLEAADFTLDSVFCVSDPTSYTVLFSTDVSLGGISVSEGTLEDLGQEQFRIFNIDQGNDLELILQTAGLHCSDTLNISAPDCGCGPISPPIPESGDLTICSGEDIPFLSVSADSGLTVNWFDAPTDGELLLSNSLNYQPTAAGVFYAESVDSLTDCTSSERTAVELVINSLPQILIDSVWCAEDQSSYHINFASTADSVWSTAEITTDSITGDYQISDIPIEDTVVVFAIENQCVDSVVIVPPNCDCPVISAPVPSGDFAICEGDTDFPDLEVQVDSGLTVNWYDSLEGGNLLLEGSLTFTPVEAGIYYAESVDTTNGCVSVSRTEFELSLLPAPSLELLEIECDDDEETYFLVLESNYEFDVIEWFLIGPGEIEFLPNNIIRITEIPISESLRIRGFHMMSGLCERTFDFDPPDCDCPDIDPPTAVETDVAYCQGEAIPTLEVEVPDGIVVNWFSEAMGGSPLLENSTSFTPAEAGIYYAEAVDTSSDCTSESRTSITLTVNPRPRMPFLEPGCIDNEFYFLRIRTNADSVISSIGEVMQETGDTFRITNIPLTEDVQLTLLFTDTGCQRIFDIEAPDCDCPFIPPPVAEEELLEICEGDPMPEMRVNVGSGLIVNWYDSPVDGNLLVGNSPNFIPSEPGTYYAEAYDPDFDCASEERTAITIEEIPEPDFSLLSATCVGEDFYQIIFQTNADEIQHTLGMLDTIDEGGYRIVMIPSDMNILLRLNPNSCLRVELIQSPDCECPELDAPFDEIEEQICEGEDLPLLSLDVADSIQVDWYDSPVGGTLIQEDASEFEAPEAGVYYAESRLRGTNCVSADRGIFVVEVFTNPTLELLEVSCIGTDGISAIFAIDAMDVLVEGANFEMLSEDSLRIFNIPEGAELVITLFNGPCEIEEIFTENECSCNPAANLIAVDPACNGVDNGSIEIFETFDLDPPFDISLNGEFIGEVVELPFLIEDLDAGTYNVSLSKDNCEYTETVELQYMIVATAELIAELNTVTPGTEIQLEFLTNLDPVTVNWIPTDLTTCDSCTTLDVVINEEVEVIVTAIDSQGCEVTASTIIEIIEDLPPTSVYVPNAFSPNDDGVNDVFRPYFHSDFSGRILSFEIYNRWGGRVFQRNNLPPESEMLGWDGQFNGSEMNPGVFIYQLEVEHNDGTIELLAGEFVLIR